jgi:hypothetical protein
MEARCQELHRELARCRTRIRQLERAIASNAPSAAPIAGPPDPGRGDDDDGHCPQCDKFGRICYDCDRYLDGLAALGQ